MQPGNDLPTPDSARCFWGTECRDLYSAGPPSTPDSDAGGPAITLSDLASFSPDSPRIRMEPEGWMARGLPANFVAEAPSGVQNGILFGRPVSVRFTASGYTWRWGDGAEDTLGTPGATWSELGVPRFSETATSHVYLDRGPVTVELAVAYNVAVSVESSAWITVDGTVTATSTIDATVVSAKTVLVDGDCASDPGGPGC